MWVSVDLCPSVSGFLYVCVCGFMSCVQVDLHIYVCACGFMFLYVCGSMFMLVELLSCVCGFMSDMCVPVDLYTNVCEFMLVLDLCPHVSVHLSSIVSACKFMFLHVGGLMPM